MAGSLIALGLTNQQVIDGNTYAALKSGNIEVIKTEADFGIADGPTDPNPGRITLESKSYELQDNITLNAGDYLFLPEGASIVGQGIGSGLTDLIGDYAGELIQAEKGIELRSLVIKNLNASGIGWNFTNTVAFGQNTTVNISDVQVLETPEIGTISGYDGITIEQLVTDNNDEGLTFGGKNVSTRIDKAFFNDITSGGSYVTFDSTFQTVVGPAGQVLITNCNFVVTPGATGITVDPAATINGTKTFWVFGCNQKDTGTSISGMGNKDEQYFGASNSGFPNTHTEALSHVSTSNPTANDDDANTSGLGIFSINSLWTNSSSQNSYICVDATATLAVWEQLDTGAGVTNLGYTASATDGTVTSDTGTDATVPAGSETNASLMLPADKTKLNGIEAISDLIVVKTASDFGIPGGGLYSLDPTKLYQVVADVDTTPNGINPKGATIEGLGNVTLSNSTVGGTLIDTATIDDLTIKNITLACDTTNASSKVFDVDVTNRNVTLLNVTVDTARNVGTFVNYANLYWENPVFTNCNFGMSFTGTIRNTHIQNPNIISNVSGFTAFSLSASAVVSNAFEINDSVVFDLQSGRTGISVHAAATIPDGQLRLLFNKFTGAGTYISGVTPKDDRIYSIGNSGIDNTHHTPLTVRDKTGAPTVNADDSNMQKFKAKL